MIYYRDGVDSTEKYALGVLAFYLFTVKSGDDFSRTVLFMLGIYGNWSEDIWYGSCGRACMIRHQAEDGKNATFLLTTEYLEQAT